MIITIVTIYHIKKKRAEGEEISGIAGYLARINESRQEPLSEKIYGREWKLGTCMCVCMCVYVCGRFAEKQRAKRNRIPCKTERSLLFSVHDAGQAHCSTGHKSDRRATTVCCAFTIGPVGREKRAFDSSGAVELAGDRSCSRKIQFGRAGAGQNRIG